ncbi:pickpocket protein 28-like [Diorhabda sublineata]|uniref:pickpocket protein 28-like n=1 Tax=Diorhabda sublineata TaxID=1163346 RepID=UPI0024E145C8|nr:pickpocket protein 28-like [Diorhabda sublineata]XP_056641254.1 pickpocket protein 28-like [Diorhabda sublineata]XP_056641255.1 pickpocket protein 28-like [Diorhabda sublineata]XP_056641256.1 pickpocket protein 28-like [Diorhabda sublineata]
MEKSRKDKKRKKIKSVKGYIKEYCNHTSIHGFKYLVEERTIIERVWWVIFIFISICLCGTMIYQIIYKYINYPLIVTFSMKETQLQKLPFPAITVCPRAKISQSYLNFTEYFQRKYNQLPVSIDEEKKVNLASTICDFYPNNSTDVADDNDFYDFLLKSRVDIFYYCQYQGVEINCTQMFTPILTEEGICYSFNILDRNDIFRNITDNPLKDFHKSPKTENWNMENGYSTKAVKTYPQRALRTGAKNALYLIFKVHISNKEFECAQDESGYRVTVHSPSNLPDVADNHISVPLSNRVLAVITPRIIQTSSSVRRFQVTARDCYFESEKKLKFFHKYSQENCLLECKSNYTLIQCGCVGIHMPKEQGTPLCLLQEQYCIERAEDLFSFNNEDLEVTEGLHQQTGCNCKPACNEITYDTELSYNTAFFDIMNKSLKAELDFEHHQYSTLLMYFKKSNVETKERRELYGFSDLISNFGGLIGLFTGFSILSLIEMIYFLTLRPLGDLFGTLK